MIKNGRATVNESKCICGRPAVVVKPVASCGNKACESLATRVLQKEAAKSD